MDTRLFCTFTNTDALQDTLKNINGAYAVAFDRIFVLENEDDLSELFCTFNIDLAKRNIQLPRTIAVHRKKDHNVIYSINAMNKLIEELNGELDPTYPVPWHDYENSILLTDSGGLNIIDTDLFMIADTKDL